MPNYANLAHMEVSADTEWGLNPQLPCPFASPAPPPTRPSEKCDVGDGLDAFKAVQCPRAATVMAMEKHWNDVKSLKVEVVKSGTDGW
ncbi:hypothetical protein MHYP_G00359790 [Metynnis hypsauchen]